MRTIKILILALCISLPGHAQDPQLFEDIWYLQKVTIDGLDYFPPSNSEIETVNLEIFDHATYYSMDTYACSIISADVNDIDNQAIDIFVFYIINGNCTLPETIAFEDLYFNGFYNWTVPDQTFSYVIESGAGNTEMLTLTNQQGDVAVYGNAALGVGGTTLEAVVLYPNPVQDLLYIGSGNNSLSAISLYSISGRVVFETHSNLHEIDLSRLPAGLYFIRLEDDTGRTVTKKVVKK